MTLAERPDERDFVIERLKRERDVWRVFTQESLHRIADLDRQLRHRRAQHDNLLAEYRALRARVMQKEVA